MINRVEFPFENPFEKLQLEEKLAIKQLGPDRPDMTIIHQWKDSGKTYNRTSARAW